MRLVTLWNITAKNNNEQVTVEGKSVAEATDNFLLLQEDHEDEPGNITDADITSISKSSKKAWVK